MIPRILHFCFGLTPDYGGKPWGLVHYACVRSAIQRIRPHQAFLYYEFQPKGPWWDLTKDLVQTVRIEAPREVFGNPLLHPAHRADVVRLQKLIEWGGIYFDCDVFVHRNFDDLLSHSTVMGLELNNGRHGLCNAVILSEPGAPFLQRWYEEYRTFRSKGRDQYWAEHACQVPLRLSIEFPAEVTVLPHTVFFGLDWTPKDLTLMFSSREPVVGPGTYANHLWESKAWEPFLADLTLSQVRKIDSAFHLWVRPVISDLPADFGEPFWAARMARKAKRFVRRLRSAASHPRLTIMKKLVESASAKLLR